MKPKAKAEGGPGAGKASRRRKWLGVAAQVALLLAALWAVSAWQTRRLLPSSSPAPHFELRTLEGGTMSVVDLRGRPAVLYFFAPWCSVCRLASQNVASLRRARGERDLAVVAVGLDWAREEEVARFAEEHGLEVPVLLGDDSVLRAYRIGAFPTFYFLDRDGQIRGRTVGYTTLPGLFLRSL